MSHQKPHIEVIARALIRRGPLLLACQNLKNDYFYLPGGHVEFGERATDALARELLEETGRRATIGPHLLTTEGRFQARGRRHHEINLIFVATLKGTPAITSREPKIAFTWLPATSLAKSDFRPKSLRPWLLARLQASERSTWSAADGAARSTWNS